jgi:wyosine [tRNA(Phe)-imidazoG37] synthetase (radical SAM superfamily)
MFTVFNKDYAEQIAKISQEFLPHEIQINTPLRPSQIKPLSKIEISQIRYHFRSIPAKIIDVYGFREKKKITPFCEENTFRRRGEL